VITGYLHNLLETLAGEPERRFDQIGDGFPPGMSGNAKKGGQASYMRLPGVSKDDEAEAFIFIKRN